MTNYDSSFFAYVNSGSIVSAKRLLPCVLDHLEISSVMDVGYGQGAWLFVWKELGVSDIAGGSVFLFRGYRFRIVHARLSWCDKGANRHRTTTIRCGGTT